MAQGDVHVFDQFLVDVFEKLHDMENDSIKCALITAAVTPAIVDADPRFGAGGTVNFKTNEVTPGGNYAADGAACLNPSVVLNGGSGIIEIDFDDPATWAQNAGNPTDARWGIVFNVTAANRCIAFVDLGSAFDMTTGDLTITWGAQFATVNQA